MGVRNKLKTAVGVVLILAGMAGAAAAGILYADVEGDERHAADASESALKLLEAQIELNVRDASPGDTVPQNGGTDEPGDAVDSTPGDSPGIPADPAPESSDAPAENGPEAPPDEPVVGVAGVDYLGVLSFPGYGMTLPVISDWDFEKLRDAPVRYSGSTAGEDLVVAGHNYRVHFGFLENMRRSDKVTFTDALGQVTEYRVAAIETLRATAVEEMTSGEWPLTLFTCTYDGQARITVRCELAP